MCEVVSSLAIILLAAVPKCRKVISKNGHGIYLIFSSDFNYIGTDYIGFYKKRTNKFRKKIEIYSDGSNAKRSE